MPPLRESQFSLEGSLIVYVNEEGNEELIMPTAILPAFVVVFTNAGVTIEYGKETY